MLKPRLSLITLAALFGLATSGVADTVILKSGEKIEGRILNESETEVTVEVAVTASIKDQRVVKKADVEKIDKVQPDLEAWKDLKALGVGPESQEAADYQRAINLLNGFLAEFPQSPHAPEARKKLTELQEEQRRVEGGELKLGGNWLSPEQVKEERVQITGRVLLGRMKQYAAAGQFSEAMNAFDAIEKTAAGSASYPDAIVLARQILPTLKAAADRGKLQLKTQVEENKRRLQNVQGADRATLETMQKRQQAQTDAIVTTYEKSGMKYLPLKPANDKSLSAISSKAGGDLVSLGRHNVDRMKNSVQATERAKAAIEKGEVAAAEAALKEASDLWSQNEYILRLQPKLAQAKTKSTATAKADADAAAKAAAAAAAESAKPKATPEPAAAPVAVVDTPKEEESPFFKKPAFWVILVIVLGLTAFLLKGFRKVHDPEKNILDQ